MSIEDQAVYKAPVSSEMLLDIFLFLIQQNNLKSWP